MNVKEDAPAATADDAVSVGDPGKPTSLPGDEPVYYLVGIGLCSGSGEWFDTDTRRYHLTMTVTEIHKDVEKDGDILLWIDKVEAVRVYTWNSYPVLY